jgi:hypothetical protein
VGQVRGLQARSEPYVEGAQQTVWSFRVERYDAATGDRVLLVPVELRGLHFDGAIADGDWVRVIGRIKAGTMRATRVEDLTTGAVITGTDRPKWVGIVILAVFALFVVLIICVVVFMITEVRKYGLSP